MHLFQMDQNVIITSAHGKVNLTPFKYKNELYFIYTFTFNSATRLFQGFLSQLDIKLLKIHIKSAG